MTTGFVSRAGRLSNLLPGCQRPKELILWEGAIGCSGDDVRLSMMERRGSEGNRELAIENLKMEIWSARARPPKVPQSDRANVRRG